MCTIVASDWIGRGLRKEKLDELLIFVAGVPDHVAFEYWSS